MADRTFYTSDLHLGHKLVAGKRGFWKHVTADGPPEPDTEAHDAHLIETWNRIVKPEDTVWVLGDVTLRGFMDVRLRAMKLNGHKNLILGNHDEAHPAHRGAHKRLHVYTGIFDVVQAAASVRLEGQQVLLSHFPYDGDREADRFTQWRLRDEGLAIIHGHTHLPGQLSRSKAGSLQIHVGLDAWEMKPVPEEIVMRYLRTGQLLGDNLGKAS